MFKTIFLKLILGHLLAFGDFLSNTLVKVKVILFMDKKKPRCVTSRFFY